MDSTGARGHPVGKGILAGFSATLALSALMWVKGVTGLMPQVDVIGMLSGMLGLSRPAAWVAHFAIGSLLWGSLYAWMGSRLPGTAWVRGALFSIGPWLLMMVLLMPMAGAGLFGLGMGVIAPVVTLVLHLVYGAVLGATYGALARGGVDPVLARR